MTWNIQSCKRRETEQFKSEGKDNAIERQTDGNVNNVLQYLIYQIRKKKKTSRVAQLIRRIFLIHVSENLHGQISNTYFLFANECTRTNNLKIYK